MRYLPLTLLTINIMAILAVVFALGLSYRVIVNNTIDVFSKLDDIEISTCNISILNKLDKHKIEYVNCMNQPENSNILKIYGPNTYMNLDKYDLTYKNRYGISLLTKKEK